MKPNIDLEEEAKATKPQPQQPPKKAKLSMHRNPKTGKLVVIGGPDDYKPDQGG